MSKEESNNSPVKNAGKTGSIQVADILALPEAERKLVNWIRRQEAPTLGEVTAQMGGDEAEAIAMLEVLIKKGFVQQQEKAGRSIYRIVLAPKRAREVPKTLVQSFNETLGKIKFSTFIGLTFITVVLLTPFALSKVYLEVLRDRAFDWHQLILGDTYKLATGYIALFFVLLEMLFTLRKRGRQWKISLPGSILVWRGLHIFIGVGLLAIVLLHTGGATGLNFNAIFLWVFFAVTLSALVGVTTETGVLESTRKHFTLVPERAGKISKIFPSFSKGKLIRQLRDIWLSTHIITVCAFFVMLAFHIFLAYYYQ